MLKIFNIIWLYRNCRDLFRYFTSWLVAFQAHALYFRKITKQTTAIQVKSIILCIYCWCNIQYSYASTNFNNIFAYPLYVGIAGGYGATTWSGLVPAAGNQNIAISLSTPVAVHEGGAVWGAFAGYEITPYFALEFNYQQYPSADIFFDENSLFTFDSGVQSVLSTRASVASIMAKIMLVVPRTTVRAYSSFGAAQVVRTDAMTHDWRVSPTFGCGFNKNIFPHIMTAVEFNYTAGYGESELNPVKDFIPFLYGVFLKVAYRI